MESNKFEQEVKKKMAEFKLAPEEQVWTRIQKEIAPKKRTPKGVLLFFLLALVSAGGFWWLNHQKSGTISSPTSENVVKKGNEEEAIGTTPNVGKIDNRSKAGIPKSLKPLENIFSSEAAASNNFSKSISGSSTPSSTQGERSILKSTNRLTTNIQKSLIANNEWQSETPAANYLTGKVVTVPSFDILSTSKQFDSQTLNAFYHPSPTLKKVKIRKSKWTLGFTLAGGSSWISKIGSSPAIPVSFTTSNFGAGYIFYQAGYASNYRSQPGSFKNSFSFTAGVNADKKLSDRIHFSSGLSYSHFSIQNNVRNSFEFLELPLLLHFRINKNDRLPFILDAGITASQMAGSDAQQYNYYSNRWYHDNTLFNKFQANAGAGLSLVIFNRQDQQIRIGPTFSYGVIQMAKRGIYDGKHLHTLNLHAEMLFGKK